MWWWIKALVGPLFWGRWTAANHFGVHRGWFSSIPNQLHSSNTGDVQELAARHSELWRKKTEDWKLAPTIWIDSGHYLQQGKDNLISATWLGNWSRFIWFHGGFKFKQWCSNHGERLCFMVPILLDSNSPRAKGCTPRKPRNWSLQTESPRFNNLLRVHRSFKHLSWNEAWKNNKKSHELAFQM